MFTFWKKQEIKLLFISEDFLTFPFSLSIPSFPPSLPSLLPSLPPSLPSLPPFLPSPASNVCPPNEGDLKSWSQWFAVLSLSRRCLHHQDSAEERGTLSAETATRILSGEIWTLPGRGLSNKAKEGKGWEEEKEEERGEGDISTIAKTKPRLSSIQSSEKHL